MGRSGAGRAECHPKCHPESRRPLGSAHASPRRPRGAPPGGPTARQALRAGRGASQRGPRPRRGACGHGDGPEDASDLQRPKQAAEGSWRPCWTATDAADGPLVPGEGCLLGHWLMQSRLRRTVDHLLGRRGLSGPRTAPTTCSEWHRRDGGARCRSAPCCIGTGWSRTSPPRRPVRVHAVSRSLPPTWRRRPDTMRPVGSRPRRPASRASRIGGTAQHLPLAPPSVGLPLWSRRGSLSSSDRAVLSRSKVPRSRGPTSYVSSAVGRGLSGIRLSSPVMQMVEDATRSAP